MTDISDADRRVDAIADDLAALPALPDTFNPYRDSCPLFDLPDAATIRRDNLTALLHSAAALDEVDVWIGREPGYLGARRTGVALTDETHLPSYGALMNVSLRRATHTDARRREPTARAIGTALASIARPVFLWNICPLHTHDRDNPMSNSKHSPEAAAVSRPVLMAVLDLLRPRRVVALGETAHKELRRSGIAASEVTHPAAWGTKRQDFYLKMDALYR